MKEICRNKIAADAILLFAQTGKLHVSDFDGSDSARRRRGNGKANRAAISYRSVRSVVNLLRRALGGTLPAPAARSRPRRSTARHDRSGRDTSPDPRQSARHLYDDIANVTFSLADAAAYRTAGASKAIPGFDVIDYGQEDYVFGSGTKDARHWSRSVLTVFEEHEDTLSPLFNNS